MRARKGKEMRRYLVSVTALVLVLLLAVIVYMTLDSVRRIDREMDEEKNRVVEQLVETFTTTTQGNLLAGRSDMMSMVMKEELVNANDLASQMMLMDFLAEMERNQFGAEYLTFVSNGNALVTKVAPGRDITDFPTTRPEKSGNDYVILKELGGREGYFISVFTDIQLAGFGEEFVNYVVDRTDQMAALEREYSDQKSSLIRQQILIGIIILVLGGIISALGVYWLTRRDITGPIEEIVRISDQLVEGTFEGEIEVNPESDFASLQSLLSSGKQLIDRMDEAQ